MLVPRARPCVYAICGVEHSRACYRLVAAARGEMEARPIKRCFSIFRLPSQGGRTDSRQDTPRK
jgi:hypothetical protein